MLIYGDLSDIPVKEHFREGAFMTTGQIVGVIIIVIAVIIIVMLINKMRAKRKSMS